MKVLLCAIVTICCINTVCAKPRLNKWNEARVFLLNKKDVPESRMSYERPTKWYIAKGTDGYTYVQSVTQRWWRGVGQTELLVETAIFPSREEALQAAQLRVKELKEQKNLQEQALKGGQLPGQASGDRAWGLFDPPETDVKPSFFHYIGPNSRYAAVVFVKKDVAVQVSTESMASANVSLDDMETLAKKIATKIKTESEPAPKDPSDKKNGK